MGRSSWSHIERRPRRITTNHQWLTDTMNNIPRVLRKERGFVASNDSSGKKMMPRSEQRSLEWLMDLMSKFW